jgi:IS5 family transposase
MKHIEKNYQRGMFDEQQRLEKLSEQNDPLEKLQNHIDFEFFRSDLEKYFAQGKDYSKGGRPSYDYVLMFKILLLQRYYSLSDDAIEFAVLDRLSFMRFLGLNLNGKVPDAKTIWNFRDQLAQSDMIKTLFKKLDKQLQKDGIIIKQGKMIDASIVETPIQRNTREENNQLKQGDIPKEWEQKPDKLRQKDTDAKWVTHNGEDYFGYKDHVKADTKTKLISDYEVTSAEVHDSQMLNKLTNEKQDGHQCFYGDSAYRSKGNQKLLKKKNITSRIHEKGYRNHQLTEKQKQRNKRKSKVRARIEHIFGFMTNTMRAMYIRCQSIKQAKTTIGLNNLTYNLFRLVQLKVSLFT